MAVPDDEQWMRRALEEAQQGVGRTSPNPPVGAVIVRDGIELGAGWHRKAGLPHAEREALAAVVQAHGPDATRGATAYVTLEPCSTVGRTPACTDGLIEAGIARVVYAALDPNPAHAGAADAVLQKQGIEVRSGVLADEAEALIRGFSMVQRNGRPWVIWKTAMSLDGRLTRPPGEGMWLTRPAARAVVQQLRSEVDAVVTSGETLRRDHPRLDVRDPSLLTGRDQPWRVVMTGKPDDLPRDAPVFTDTHADRTLVRGRDSIAEVLAGLSREQDIHTVLLECGGRLAGAFMDLGLIDEVVAFAAPMICGGDVTALAGEGTPDGWNLTNVRFQRVGEDVMMRGVVRR